MWPLRVLDSKSFLVERSDMKECGWTRRGPREGPQEIGNQDLLLGSMDSPGSGVTEEGWAPESGLILGLISE